MSLSLQRAIILMVLFWPIYTDIMTNNTMLKLLNMGQKLSPGTEATPAHITIHSPTHRRSQGGSGAPPRKF